MMFYYAKTKIIRIIIQGRCSRLVIEVRRIKSNFAFMFRHYNVGPSRTVRRINNSSVNVAKFR
jgi:hypothetical protein